MLSYQFTAGLGNTILRIFSLFYYCRQRSINTGNIILNLSHTRYFNCGDKILTEKVFDDNIDLFDNIRYCFKDYIEYSELIKDSQNITFNSDNIFEYPTNNIIFTGNNFLNRDVIVTYKELFLELFYNSRIMDTVVNKNSHIINKPFVAIHARRGDFVYHDFKKYIIPDDEIKSIIESESDNVVIFSDDIGYYKNVFGEYDNVLFSDINKPYEDIYLMSISKKLYTTGYSTFSIVGRICREIFPKH